MTSCEASITRSQLPGASDQQPEISSSPFIIPIFLPHAGCPHRCVFCNQSSITGVRSKVSREAVSDQIEAFLKFKNNRRHIVQIAFFGGNFLGMPPEDIERLLAVAAEYVAAGRVNGIRFSTRPDTIDFKRLGLIRKFPVTTVELGVQSMDDGVLKRANRGHSVLDTQKAIQNLKKYDYEIGVQLMVGLPGDTPRRLVTSALQVARLNPDFVRIYPTVVLKGSPLAARHRSGDYVPLNLETAVTLTKTLYLLFKKEHIRVIRMGLQASEALENGSVILAGPYHPAFGHLVYSEVFLDMAIAALESGTSVSDPIRLHVHPRSISRMKGLKKKNIHVLKEKFAVKSIAVIADASLGMEDLQVN